jgi:hypothetical protein
MNRLQTHCKKSGTMFSIIALVLIALSSNCWADTQCSEYGGIDWAKPEGDAVGQIMAIITYNSDTKPNQLAGIHLVGYLNGANDKNCFGIVIKDDARASQLLSTALAAYMAGKTVLIHSEKNVAQYIWLRKP